MPGKGRRPIGNPVSNGNFERILHACPGHKLAVAEPIGQARERLFNSSDTVGKDGRDRFEAKDKAGVDHILAGRAEMERLGSLTLQNLAHLLDKFRGNDTVTSQPSFQAFEIRRVFRFKAGNSLCVSLRDDPAFYLRSGQGHFERHHGRDVGLGGQQSGQFWITEQAGEERMVEGGKRHQTSRNTVSFSP